MRIRKRVISALLAAGVVGAIAVSTTPASASVSSGYISGQDSWTDDWHDEGPIGVGQHDYSNAAWAWINILWADGKLPGVSCEFDGDVAVATEHWQETYTPNDDADGIVGPKTLTQAESYMTEESGHYIYHGTEGRTLEFTRNSSGQWGLYFGSEHHLLSYTYANFYNC